MAQIAVDWLMEQITYEKDGKRICYYVEPFDVSHLFEQAKKIEHTQIMDAYNQGYRDYFPPDTKFGNSEDYFNKTYNNNHFTEVGNKVIEKPN